MVGPHRSLVPRLVTSWSRNSISIACVDALPMSADPAGRCVQWVIDDRCGAVFGDWASIGAVLDQDLRWICSEFGVLIKDWWIGTDFTSGLQ